MKKFLLLALAAFALAACNDDDTPDDTGREQYSITDL